MGLKERRVQKELALPPTYCETHNARTPKRHSPVALDCATRSPPVKSECSSLRNSSAMGLLGMTLSTLQTVYL
jgi:hypothetical protein